MKFFILLAAATVMLSWTAVHAADDDVVVQRSTHKIVEEDSSEHNRMGKKFSITGQLFGSGANNAHMQGVAVAYHVDRNSLIQAEVGSGSANWSYNGISTDKFSGTSAGVHYKRFLGNSFYVRGGLNYRSFNYTGSLYYYNSDPVESVGLDGQSLDASLLIGNQWQWQNFTLGCDWIGMGTPLVSSSSNERIPTNPTFSDDGRRELQHAKDVWLKYSYLQVLRFYVGYSF